MSRLGKKPLPVPEDVKVVLNDTTIKISGKHGELSFDYPQVIEIKFEENVLRFIKRDDSKQTKAFHGLVASHTKNMVIGVTEKFTKELHLIGTGYTAMVTGPWLKLYVGHSHEILLEIPEGLEINAEKPKSRATKLQSTIKVTGINKQLVGHFASVVRDCRPPENYKGKGIRYHDEHVIIKPGKTTA